MERRTFLCALGRFAGAMIVAPDVVRTIFIPPPPQIVAPSLTHMATAYYHRMALDQFKNKFEFMREDVSQIRSGKTIQWYRYSLID